MTRRKIPCESDSSMEEYSEISIETCTGYVYDDGTVKILGEAVTTDEIPIDEYKTIQVILYDADGDIIDRHYTNWSEFGLRQSFKFEFGKFDETVAKIKVYPTNE
mgnify:CR=1 FL=1